jgi:hypothetical protein
VVSLSPSMQMTEQVGPCSRDVHYSNLFRATDHCDRGLSYIPPHTGLVPQRVSGISQRSFPLSPLSIQYSLSDLSYDVVSCKVPRYTVQPTLQQKLLKASLNNLR